MNSEPKTPRSKWSASGHDRLQEKRQRVRLKLPIPVSATYVGNAVAISKRAQQAETLAESRLMQRMKTLISSRASLYVTLVVLIPRFYNPDSEGIRRPVEPEKILETVREIRAQFSGFCRSGLAGWYRDESTNEEFTDRLLRFEIDFVPDRRRLVALKSWKRTLERRFEQRSIYFKFMLGVVCW